jgi:hypothetical protein
MTRVVDEFELLSVVATRFDIRAVTKDEVLIRAFHSTAEPVHILMSKNR